MTTDPTATSVRLHQTLYTRDAIAEAAETFAGLATFAIRTDGDHHVVDIAEITRDVDGDVVAEFCNFALANSARAQRSTHA